MRQILSRSWTSRPSNPLKTSIFWIVLMRAKCLWLVVYVMEVWPTYWGEAGTAEDGSRMNTQGNIGRCGKVLQRYCSSNLLA